MINVRCLRSSIHQARKQYQAHPNFTQCRKISSNPSIRRDTRIGSPQSNPILQLRPQCRNQPVCLFSLSPRFASSRSTPQPLAPNSQPPSSGPPEPPPSAPFDARSTSNPNSLYANNGDEFSPDPYASAFEQGAEPPVEEYIGFLKEMGLDYGWGTTALVEYVMEHVHVWGGLPWWSSIIVSALLIRAAVFRYYIKASDTSARMAAIKHLTDPFDARIREARLVGDQVAMKENFTQRRAILKEAGVKYTTIFLPIVLQIPLGFGTFRLLRGMTNLPVPGMDTGGFLWFQDLTVPDPLFILPAITTALFYMTFKLGGESGTTNSNMSPATMRLVGIVLPSITGIFALFWPAGLQVAIAFGGFLAMGQGWILRRPWFRHFLQMQPLPRSKRPITTSDYKGTINTGQVAAGKQEKKGLLGGMKSAYSDLVKQGREISGKRNQRAKARSAGRTEAEVKKAKAYDEKVLRQEAQRKFEAAQEREAREEERKERRRLR